LGVAGGKPTITQPINSPVLIFSKHPLSGRAQWEIHFFFAAWLLALLHAALRRSASQAWREQLILIVILLLCLPILNLLVPSYRVLGELAAGNWQRVSVDLICLVSALIIVWQMRRAAKKTLPRVPPIQVAS